MLIMQHHGYFNVEISWKMHRSEFWNRKAGVHKDCTHTFVKRWIFVLLRETTLMFHWFNYQLGSKRKQWTTPSSDCSAECWLSHSHTEMVPIVCRLQSDRPARHNVLPFLTNVALCRILKSLGLDPGPCYRPHPHRRRHRRRHRRTHRRTHQQRYPPQYTNERNR